MTEAQVSEIIGGVPHAAKHTVFAAPFSGKAMPVAIKQWWGQNGLTKSISTTTVRPCASSGS
jgi:hypothetical protein